MLIRRALSFATLAAMLLTVPALAWGPHDGSYLVEVSKDGVVLGTTYLVVLQDGPNLGLAVLAPDGGLWTWGLGTPVGPAHYQGAWFAASGTQIGTFDFQFNGDQVVGTTVGLLVGQISGGRFWGANLGQ